MGLITFGTNVASLQAQRQLANANEEQGQLYNKLSSGMRITRASDDAAGLAIANNLSVSRRVYGQSQRNINDGISALSIAQAAGSELSSVLTRIQELAAQAANGSYGIAQRTAIDTEAQALRTEFNRIVSTTSFNGIKLLDGTFTGVRIQAGVTDTSSRNLNLDIGTSGIAQTVIHAGTFVTPQSLGGGGGRMVVGDYNGDGFEDVASLGFGGGNNVGVLISNGNGTLKAARQLVGGTLSSIEQGDFNGDGSIDIAANDSTRLYIFTNNGDGTFKAGVSYARTTNLQSVADFNGDGVLDLLANSGTQTIIRFGNSDGTFADETVIKSHASTFQSIAADLNNDGLTDIFESRSGGYSTMLGNGDGSFSAPFAWGGAATADDRISALRDFNNDGNLDFIFTSNSSYNIVLSNGNGTFRAAISRASTASNGTPLIDDLNDDGNLDLVIGANAFSNGGPGALHYGNGDGTFRFGSTIQAASSGLAVSAFVDLNNDGVKDIFYGSGFYGYGKTISNATTQPYLSRFSLSTVTDARSALTSVRSAQEFLSAQLAKIGAQQSRLLTANASLATMSENYASAESRITDVDVADATSRLTQKKIIQDIGSSILAQANQLPQLALQLLR